MEKNLICINIYNYGYELKAVITLKNAFKISRKSLLNSLKSQKMNFEFKI